MATRTKQPSYDMKRAALDYYVYVPLGATQLLVENTKRLYGSAWDMISNGRQTASKTYRDLAERGERIASSVKRSAYTQRAMDQSKTARAQVKGAATSVRKALTTTATATKTAAKNVG